MRIHTPRSRVRPSLTSSVQITPTMRTPYTCVLLYTLLACTHAVRHITERATTRGHLPALIITCTSTSRIKNTPLPPLTPGATETGIQTHSTSFPSPRLLIPHRRHPLGAVRARTRYRRRSSCHSTVPPAWHAQVRLRAGEATTSHEQSPVVRQGKGTCRRQFWFE